MSLETIASIIAQHARCSGLSVDIRILRSPGMALRLELDRDGHKVPLDTEDFVKLPVEGVMIGTTHIIVRPDSRGYVLIRIGPTGEGILLPPSVPGKAGWTIERVITDAFFRVISWRIKRFNDEALRCDDPEFAAPVLAETSVVPVVRRKERLEALELAPAGTKLPFSNLKNKHTLIMDAPRVPPTQAPPPPAPPPTTPGTPAPTAPPKPATPPGTPPPPRPAPPKISTPAPAVPTAPATWRPKRPAPAAVPEAPVAPAFASAPAGPAAPAVPETTTLAATPAPAGTDPADRPRRGGSVLRKTLSDRRGR